MLLLGRLSPYPLDAADIREREQELAALAGRLEGALHPNSAAGLREALAGVHSYYSNLIEGPSTEPIAAELAIAGRVAPAVGSPEEKYVIQAHAGIETAFLMQAELLDPKVDPASADFIRFLHREFTSRLPEEMRWVEGPDGTRVKLVPGEFRTGHVQVGRHIPPDPGEVPQLIAALSEFSKIHGRTLASMMLMHHRFAWIHPFFDGNGRTAVCSPRPCYSALRPTARDSGVFLAAWPKTPRSTKRSWRMPTRPRAAHTTGAANYRRRQPKTSFGSCWIQRSIKRAS
jgi:Fic family protein